MNIRPVSFLRAAGSGLGVLLGLRGRARVTAATYAASRAIEPQGVALLPVRLEDPRYPQWVHRAAPEATSLVAWVVLNEVLGGVARRLPGPKVLGAALLGGAVYYLDTTLADKSALGLARTRVAEQQAAAAGAVGM